MSLYEMEDLLYKNFSSIPTRNEPFWRFQLRIENLEKILKKEEQQNERRRKEQESKNKSKFKPTMPKIPRI